MMIIAIAAVIIAPISAVLLQMALSRRREYLADASAAEITGDPEGLALALAKLRQRQDAAAARHARHGAPLHRVAAARQRRAALEPRRHVRHAPAARGAHPPPRGGRRLRHPRSRAAAAVTLPLAPTIEPQLAKTATELPAEGDWLLRAEVGRLPRDRVRRRRRGVPAVAQRQAARPLLPRALAAARPLRAGRRDRGRSRRRQPGLRRARSSASTRPPRASSCWRARRRRRIVAFDLLAEGDEVLHGAAVLASAARRSSGCWPTSAAIPSSLTPQELTIERAERWLDTAEGVIAKQADAPYLPGQAHRACSRCGGGARSTASICGYRPGTRARQRRLAHPRRSTTTTGEMHVVGHCSAFTRKEKRELLERAAAVRDGRARLRRGQPLDGGPGARVGRAAPGARRRGLLRPRQRRPHPARHARRALARRPRSGRAAASTSSCEAGTRARHAAMKSA